MALLGLEIVCVCGYIDWLLVAGRVWWTLRRSVSRFPLRLQSRDVVFVEGMGGGGGARGRTVPSILSFFLSSASSPLGSVVGLARMCVRNFNINARVPAAHLIRNDAIYGKNPSRELLLF